MRFRRKLRYKFDVFVWIDINALAGIAVAPTSEVITFVGISTVVYPFAITFVVFALDIAIFEITTFASGDAYGIGLHIKAGRYGGVASDDDGALPMSEEGYDLKTLFGEVSPDECVLSDEDDIKEKED